MNLAKIISEADGRVTNNFTSDQKLMWLNEINQEFFDVVKIPKAATFTTVSGQSSVVLTLPSNYIPTDVRGKNIDKVHVGKAIYPSFLYNDVSPGHNYHTFDEETNTLTIVPTPTAVISGIVKYFRIATTAFLAGGTDAEPDAPDEYHWIYVLGLCERIANAMDDVPRASTYGQQYRGQLSVAQANFGGGGA